MVLVGVLVAGGVHSYMNLMVYDSTGKLVGPIVGMFSSTGNEPPEGAFVAIAVGDHAPVAELYRNEYRLHTIVGFSEPGCQGTTCIEQPTGYPRITVPQLQGYTYGIDHNGVVYAAEYDGTVCPHSYASVSNDGGECVDLKTSEGVEKGTKRVAEPIGEVDFTPPYRIQIVRAIFWDGFESGTTSAWS